MTEKWAKIPYYPDYEISSFGRVRSFKNGETRILQPVKGKDDYRQISLSRWGKAKNYRIHRLVANAFIPNPSNFSVVDHINTDVSDNRVENLRWVDQKANINNPMTRIHISASQNGVKNHMFGRTGKLHHRSKAVIRLEDQRVFGSIHEASREIGIHSIAICRCCKKQQNTCGGYHWAYAEVKEE